MSKKNLRKKAGILAVALSLTMAAAPCVYAADESSTETTTGTEVTETETEMQSETETETEADTTAELISIRTIHRKGTGNNCIADLIVSGSGGSNR